MARTLIQEPPPDRLVGCVNTSLGQQFLDIPKGQGEPGIEPDRVADDFWREAVALKRYRSHPMMLIGDQPPSYPSYRDIAYGTVCRRGRNRLWPSDRSRPLHPACRHSTDNHHVGAAGLAWYFLART